MNKKLLILTSLMLLNSSIATYAYQVTTITPLQPPLGYGSIYPNYQNNGTNQSDSYPKITKVEDVLFSRTFINEDIYNRLNRIEKKMFNQTNPNMDLAQRVDLISQNINPSAMYNIPLENLSQIEYKLFNRSYSGDDVETRIIRLEKEMLGAMQQGGLEERFNVVASAAKHYNAFPPDMYNGNNQQYQKFQQPYIASSNTGNKNGIIHNVLSALTAGTLTGFTPPITDPYGSYCSSPYMSNPYTQNNWSQNLYPGGGAGFSNSMQTNSGYSNINKNYGTGSGVHVLYD